MHTGDVSEGLVFGPKSGFKDSVIDLHQFPEGLPSPEPNPSIKAILTPQFNDVMLSRHTFCPDKGDDSLK